MEDLNSLKPFDDNNHNDAIKIKVTETTGPDTSSSPFEDVSSASYYDDTRSGRSGVGNLLGQAARLSINLLVMPLNLLPGQSRYHAKNSIREGVLSFKTLVDDVTGALDRNLSQSMARDQANQLHPAAYSGDIPPATPGSAVESAVEEAGDINKAI